MTDRSIQRRRSIAEVVLRTLANVWEANPDAVLLWRHILTGLQRASQLPPTEDEARSALRELLERGLARRQDTEAGEIGYVVTPAGRDFLAHDFPWQLLDSFAGRRRRAGGQEGEA